MLEGFKNLRSIAQLLLKQVRIGSTLLSRWL
jgi:hypothetical protein